MHEELEELKEKHGDLRSKHKALSHKFKQLEKIHQDLSTNYFTTSATLEKVNKERQRLYEDAVRSERIIHDLKEELEQLNKAFDNEKNNYGILPF